MNCWLCSLGNAFEGRFSIVYRRVVHCRNNGSYIGSCFVFSGLGRQWEYLCVSASPVVLLTMSQKIKTINTTSIHPFVCNFLDKMYTFTAVMHLLNLFVIALYPYVLRDC